MFRQGVVIIHLVKDSEIQMGVEGMVLNLGPVWKWQWGDLAEIWPGKWDLWLMVVRFSFLKCDVLSQF